MATLTHEEMILVTRLMTNHLVGDLPPEIEKLTQKLLDYAQRTTGDYATEPFKLRATYYWGRPQRAVFALDTLDAGV